MSKHHYIGIDPGFTSGYACCDEDGTLTSFDQITGPDEFMDWLEGLRPHPQTIVLEDYIIRRGVSHTGSRAPTIQLIGVIKRYAKNHGIQVIMQQSHVKEIGYKFAGIPKPKSHAKSHKFDAVAHLIYYLQKTGVRESRVERTGETAQ